LSLLSYLKSHPFAVEAFFESSLVLTYAIPVKQLQSLIPPCLQLDTLNGQYGFIAIAVVKTKGLRPKGFPEFIGNDFILTGYRIFVTYITSEGKRLRGLYVIKSETDKVKMAILGNLMTTYNYTLKNITYKRVKEIIEVQIPNSDFDIQADFNQEEVLLPANSPFTTWKEARRFAGPLPFTFTYNVKTKAVLIIEGHRENWTPKPVKIKKANIGFFRQMELENVILASAFIVEDIPYCWKKGRFDTWIP
jgi:uncharacterized protein YqjF (DUF2071 family)